ncbi:Uncharacterised protein [Slackia heliotrinireducens]|uniref:Uncharacterized protein n=1 Tax=Slackia heliotrinireducens (strain ATCC 29202 / DSM 20476 / NCTC 11029 / RHS 1) TaxID=471855 RepID=C7N3T3_SLAHD|nr:hypothetical protein [Slackia heliotrinireducens]ACV21674.1 hypothetical protein Shel_06150 [Slackia heliotrinireducens DSM 20476]VEG99289.1 Uncharacterised protein [Slackia heliotrinireducens]
MDTDIRDFIIEDDLFDPFMDENEDDDRAEIDEEPETPLIGEPLDEWKKPVEDWRPAQVRIKDLFEEMPGQKRMMLKIIDYCREERTGEEMDVFTNDLKQYCYSVYSPVVFRELLEEAGAIEYIKPDEPEGSQDAAQSEERAQAGGELPEEAVSPHRGDVYGTLPVDDESTLVPIDGADIVHESYIEGDEEIQMDFLEITPCEPGTWKATEAGLEAVDSMDDLDGTKELLGKEPKYLDIYHQILDYCQDEYGRSSKEIDKLVNDSPLLEEPRRYSGYFVSRLEKQGALEWRNGWFVTEVGKKIIEEAAAHV